MPTLAGGERDFAPAIESDRPSLSCDFLQRAQFAVSDSQLLRRRAELYPLALRDFDLCLLVDANTLQPLGIIIHAPPALPAFPLRRKLDCKQIGFAVHGFDARVLARPHAE
jgi:hypothetical protein